MKKAKIMLLFIAVIAIVGTALAFKINKLGNTKYCYTITESESRPEDCWPCKVNAAANPYTNGTKIYYSATTNCDNCGTFGCPNVGHYLG